MIIGHIKGKQDDIFYHPVLRQTLQYLRDTDFAGWEPGKYPLDGDKLFLLVQEGTTEPFDLRKPESHERYIDIQYLLAGQERFGVAFRTGAEAMTENSLAERDIAFYATVYDENQVVLQPGMYAVFFPTDIHRPLCMADKPEAIRKVVVKMDVGLFD